MISSAQIIGVLNVTPDSFSDGGEFLDVKNAVKRAKEMMKQGADIIDVGAESTAPHNSEISANEEWMRLEHILPELLQQNISISLDSQKAETWEKFLQLCEHYKLNNVMINDVSGLSHSEKTRKEEQKKIGILQEYPEVKIVIMYSRDISNPDPENLQETIISEISNFFHQKILLLKNAGIKKSRIILDPGMGGFLSKNPKISFEVLRNFSEFSVFQQQGYELYLGTSRKSFLSEISGNVSPEKRVVSSVVSSLLGIQKGADYVRVHDVQEMREALDTLNTVNL